MSDDLDAPTPLCQSLRFGGVLDFTGHRCGRPEDDPMHDPLGPADCHVYDPAPQIDRLASEDETP